VVCAREFYDRQASTIRQKYCSGKCYGQAKQARIAESYPKRSEVAALYRRGKSDRQVGRHFGHTGQWAMYLRRHYGIAPGPRGRKKPLHRAGDRLRWGIHRKLERACRNCGATPEHLDLHHAIPRSLSRAAKYDLRNGLPLCDRCHVGWHRKLIVIYRDVFTPEEWTYLVSVKIVGRETLPWLDKHYPPRIAP
jgi:5-methylcytosine-specific restriction endonuclease McrA